VDNVISDSLKSKCH